MQSALDTKLTPHADVLASAVSPADKLSGRRVEAWRQRLIVLALIFSDFVLALDVWGLASLFHGSFLGEPSAATVAGIVVGTLAWIGLRALLGLYPGYGLDQAEELRRQTYALLAAGAITAICAVALQIGSQVSRPTLALGFAGLLVLSPLVRQLVKGQMIRAGIWGKPIVLVGSGEPGMRFAQLLEKERGLGLRPVALFDGGRFLTEDGFPGATGDEGLIHVTDLARKHGINTIVFAMPNARQKHLARLVDLASYGFRHVVVISAMDGITNSATVARDYAGTFGVEIKYNLLDPWAQRSKRVLDVGATVIGGALVLLPILILSLLVWMESGRPIFYADKRMGRNGSLFSCVKFRTMVPDAEALLQQVLAQDAEMREEYLKYHKLRHDPRVTRMGRLLRKTSLDELPQLWNVIKGEMSLVGPRPYLPRESADIGASQSEILRVTPGITGPWQVTGRNHATFGERVGMDAYYVRNWSVWLDLVILARTVSTLLLGRGELADEAAPSSAPEGYVRTVLFVCTANVCRSPMAEAIFNALAEDRLLPYRARSSGLAALEDEPMAPNARAALEEVGIPAGHHRARQVNESMLREADLVLAMGPRHMAQLRERYGSLSYKVHTLPRYASGAPGEDGISDPYGQAMTAYRASLYQLVGYIDSLVGVLRKTG